MAIHFFNSFSLNRLSFFKESFLPVLNHQQKKIFIIVSLALSCLGLYYLFKGCESSKHKFSHQKNSSPSKQSLKIKEKLNHLSKELSPTQPSKQNSGSSQTKPNETGSKDRATEKSLPAADSPPETAIEQTGQLSLTSGTNPSKGYLVKLPNVILTSIFLLLGTPPEWRNFSVAHRVFNPPSKTRLVIAHVLNVAKTTASCPLGTKLKFVKQAGPLITTLDVSGTKITNAQLAEIFNYCPNIQKLLLSGCRNLTDDCLQGMPTTVTSIKVNGCSLLTNDAFLTLPEGLKEFNGNDCPLLSNEIFTLLPEKLEVLKLARCSGLTERSSFGLQRFTGLTTAILDSTLVSDMNLLHFNDVPPSLTHLSLSLCPNVIGDSFENLTTIKFVNVSGCPNLRTLNFPSNPPLNYLNVSGCYTFPRHDLKFLPLSLKTFKIIDCTQLSALDIQKFKLKHTGCQVIQ